MNKLGSILRNVSVLSAKRRSFVVTQRSFSILNTLKSNENQLKIAEEEIVSKWINNSYQITRNYSSINSSESAADTLTEIEFEKCCSETLEHLSDYFDELVESHKELEAADVVYKAKMIFSHFLSIYNLNWFFNCRMEC